MQKRDYTPMEAWREATEIMHTSGLLLVSADANGKPNVMTIGWALLGITWGKPIMAVLVRPSRFTYGLIDMTEDFTVNVPVQPDMDEIVRYCGTKSGRNYDKFAEKGLTPVPARHVLSPIIAECLLHYECKVVHKNDVNSQTLAPAIIANYYPRGDFHRVFFGEVVATYGVADFQQRFNALQP